MAGDHREGMAATEGPAGQHAPVSRRSVLRGAAGASAAGLMAASALAARPAVARPARSGQPAERPARSAAAMTTAADPGDAAGPLVIHVRDARTGEMDIFAGTTRTRLSDPALAARLVRASK